MFLKAKSCMVYLPACGWLLPIFGWWNAYEARDCLTLPLIMVQWKMGSWKMFFSPKRAKLPLPVIGREKKSRQSPNMRDDPYYFLGEEEWHWAWPLKFPIMSTNLELVSQSGGVYLLGNGRTLKPQPNLSILNVESFTLIEKKRYRYTKNGYIYRSMNGWFWWDQWIGKYVSVPQGRAPYQRCKWSYNSQ